ncbi:MAG: VOC family protein [Acetivibrionales bacterium]|jgi:lactoylglutathione lyase|nr:VOC family protein [Clostridiaceae bacterium]
MDITNHVKGLQHIGIPTTDIEKTKQWYKRIGFEIVNETKIMDEKGEVSVAFLKLGNVVLEIYQSQGARLEELKQRETGAVDHIALDVDDIDKVYEKIAADGIMAIEGSPKFLPFWMDGVRFFTIYGPNNEKIEFNQML